MANLPFTCVAMETWQPLPAATVPRAPFWEDEERTGKKDTCVGQEGGGVGGGDTFLLGKRPRCKGSRRCAAWGESQRWIYLSE